MKLFWEGSFLMAVEFYLAFQANGCLVHAPLGQESTCDNIIHSNLISGMNIILIFLVVRVILFKMGDLTITRTLHLELRPYEVSLCANLIYMCSPLVLCRWLLCDAFLMNSVLPLLFVVRTYVATRHVVLPRPAAPRP